MLQSVSGFMSDIGAEVYSSELSTSNKLGRLLWAIVYCLCFRITPRPLHAWRCFLLRVFGAKIGQSVKVYASARIWAPWNLKIDTGAILGDRVDCYCVAPIEIGVGAVISQDSCLCAATHDYRSDAFTLIPKPIVIESGAWIAARAFVGPGVTIGNRSVVGACSVVFKDVEAGVAVVGNPAQELKFKI